MPSPSLFIVVSIIYFLLFSPTILATREMKYEASTRFKPKINGIKEGDNGDQGVKDCLPKGIKRSSAPSRYINDHTLGSTSCSSIKKVNKP
ncbi:hypothetical protein RND71_022181 [Anisodus tanguticus]|uniref:Transmembrane protein n=1 Tax=Anisodus tanguticus TaxID=243964 RepID=A0AAE1RYF2_9SOLA|nr:hypothetical protein RND71_022181 [Anisodus tanguticus]